MSYFKFLTIFETNLINSCPIRIVSDPVIINIFNDTKDYTVIISNLSTQTKGRDQVFSETKKLQLKKGIYIELIARTKETIPSIARVECEKETDKIITLLSLLLHNAVFGRLIYQGWLWEDGTGIFEAWNREGPSFSIKQSDLDNRVRKIKSNLSGEIKNRFELMSRFYSKSLLYKPCEEKLVLLWTIFEIFPMKDTTNIKPINELLAKITKKPYESICQKIGVGKIYNKRCNLVHNGKLDIPISEKEELFTKLEIIVDAILMNMIGLDYNNSLDRYL